MSWDFPDGPDYNPEPLDDDPWDVSTSTEPEDCLPEATEDDLSPSHQENEV